MLMNEELNNFR